MKEKMLLKLEKERLVIRNVDLHKSKKELEEKINRDVTKGVAYTDLKM